MAGKKHKKIKKIKLVKVAKSIGLFAWQKILPWMLLVGALVFCAHFVQDALNADPHLRIQAVNVIPATALSPEKRHELDRKYLGKHILRVDLQKISNELCSDPEIKSAEVIRRFPSILEIYVAKREPLGILMIQPKGKTGVISKDGVVLQVLSETVKGLTVFQMPFLNAADLRVGARIRAKSFSKAADLFETYKASEWAKTYFLETISIDAQGNINVYFPNAPEIRMGRSPLDRMPLLEKAFHLFEDKDSLNIAYIDLQYDNVVVRKKG